MATGRVSDVLRRIEENICYSDIVKTCLGILSILSREETSKQAIFKEGLGLVLNAMGVHADRLDVQEVGCELIWSLAFKNSVVKDMFAKLGGALVIVRALRRHSRSADFLRNVCGAISNVSQCRLNQESVCAQGGLAPLVAAVHVHIENPKILPFIFDALAALIVSNEDSGRTASSLGLVPLVIASLTRYPSQSEVCKSGCHALAILTDVKGQATKISGSGGVAAMLAQLTSHPTYTELHRVALVVLLRMLQESASVGREIVQGGGVRALLEGLDEREDTVAAVAHILQAATSPAGAAFPLVEAQLWRAQTLGSGDSDDPSRARRPGRGAGQGQGQSALGGVVRTLLACADRRDVVKSSARVLNNVLALAGVAQALNGLHLLSALFGCLACFEDCKELHQCVLGAAAQLAARKIRPLFAAASPRSVTGFAAFFRVRLADEESDAVELALGFLASAAVSFDSDLGKIALSESLHEDVFEALADRARSLLGKAQLGELTKPLRTLSRLLDLAAYFVHSHPRLAKEVLAEGSVLDHLLAAAEAHPVAARAVRQRVEAMRGRAEGARADEGGGSEVPLQEEPCVQTQAPVVASALPPLLQVWPAAPEPLLSLAQVAASLALRTAAPPADTQPAHLVYACASAAGLGVASRCAVDPCYAAAPLDPCPFAHSLLFDAEFEAGNLGRAVQREAAAYDLFLREDLHTPGHTQWFFFSVTRTHAPALAQMASTGLPVPPARVRFSIVNLTKPESLFNRGMQPVMYSYAGAERGVGWTRCGADVCYHANQYPRSSGSTGEGDDCFYSLAFTVDFPNANDTYLLAYTYPYTYSDCCAHVARLLAAPQADRVIRRHVLCKSLGGFDCDLIAITNFMDRRPEKIGPTSVVAATGAPKRSKGAKPCLFFSARVHPSEAQASWMMRGMLDFLVSDAPSAVCLRELFVIFLVPMLNVDGVVYGNTRCGLAGADLNRMWRSPTTQHPTVLALKAFMLAQRRHRDIAMFVDLHGHSRKHNVFMYGCGATRKTRALAVAFPRLLSLHGTGRRYVSLADCSFSVKKSRESTARVVVCKEIGVLRSYTLEATFSGPDFGELRNTHMHIGHLLEVGAGLCDAIAQFCQGPLFAKEFSLSLDTVSVTVPRDADALCVEYSEKDDLDNGDVSSGSDEDEAADAARRAGSGDTLDSFMEAQDSSSKRKSLVKAARPAPSAPLQGRAPSIRVVTGQNTLATLVKKSASKANRSSADSSEEELAHKLGKGLVLGQQTAKKR